MKADPREVITIDLREWRIVDDAIWFAVQERFSSREPTVRNGRPAAKYALTSIAKVRPMRWRDRSDPCVRSAAAGDGVLQLVLDEIRNEIAAQLPEREADVSVARSRAVDRALPASARSGASPATRTSEL